jgi:hypothetical protein
VGSRLLLAWVVRAIALPCRSFLQSLTTGRGRRFLRPFALPDPDREERNAGRHESCRFQTANLGSLRRQGTSLSGVKAVRPETEAHHHPAARTQGGQRSFTPRYAASSL